MPGITPSDALLIRTYLEGEADAHRQVDRWIRMVVASRHWGLESERDDLAQEVRKRLFVNLSQERFQGNASLKTYVAQIAKYTCIESLRKKIRQRTVDIDFVEVRDDGPNPEARFSASQKSERVAEAMSKLPEGCRVLFGMIFDEQLPYDIIGEKLGVAEGTVKSRASRCRQQLVRLLGLGTSQAKR